MTLVEFIAPVKGKSRSKEILATMLYASIHDKLDGPTVSQIRDSLRTARIKGYKTLNISDVLAKSGHYVQSEGNGVWKLTGSGKTYIRKELGLPKEQSAVEKDISTLATTAAKIADPLIRDYIDEAITCLRVDARRACVVFAWTGAIRVIHEQILAYGKKALNAAILKHDPRARTVSRIDHFAYIKDKTVLLAAQELGIFDKTEKDTLEEALNLRNRCGHPAKYNPGEKKVSSFIEDLVSIVF